MTEQHATARPHNVRAHRKVGLWCGGLAVGMLALAFAAVPLYRLFCQTTGYNGTTQRAERPSTEVLDRTVTVRFDANIAPGMGWTFEPVARTMKVRLGETSLAFYRATNTTDHTIKGSAVFNVLPEATGIHFQKIECFCFKEQTLAPGESVDMPVSFYIDTAMARDHDLDGVSTVTLSYTFYPIEDTKPAKAPNSSKETRGGS